MYSRPGSFAASLRWYRSSSNPVTAYAAEIPPQSTERLAVPTTILWQEHDPIFPFHWLDRIEEFFLDYRLEPLAGVGHFTPLEAADKFAAAIKDRLRSNLKKLSVSVVSGQVENAAGDLEFQCPLFLLLPSV